MIFFKGDPFSIRSSKPWRTIRAIFGNVGVFLNIFGDFRFFRIFDKKVLFELKKFKDNGATILGGCCETRPSHINAMATIE